MWDFLLGWVCLTSWRFWLCLVPVLTAAGWLHNSFPERHGLIWITGPLVILGALTGIFWERAHEK